MKKNREKIRAEKAARKARGFEITNVPMVNNFNCARSVTSNGTTPAVTAGLSKTVKGSVPATVNNFETCVPTVAKSLNVYPADTKTKVAVDGIPAINGVAQPDAVHPTPKMIPDDTFAPVINVAKKPKGQKS